MNLQQTTLITTRTNISAHPLAGRLIRQLSQYVLCTSLGIVGGGAGVATVMGGAIFVQALSSSPSAFLPNVTMLTLAAVLIGLGISWLLSQTARRLLPSFGRRFSMFSLQIVFIASALTSLLENYLFMHNITALSIPTNAVWVSLVPLLQLVS